MQASFVTDHLKSALAQINPTVGALEANLLLGLETLGEAVAGGADIIMFAELFLTGYFPEDLLFKPRFVDDAMRLAKEFARKSAKFPVSILMPTIWRQDGALFNAVLLIENGKIVQKRFKHRLPNDDRSEEHTSVLQSH